jgi:hypothetical protein
LEEEQSTSTPKRRTKKSSGAASQASVGVSDKKTDSKSVSKRTSTGLQQRFVDVLGWGIFILWAVGFSVDMLDLKKDWDLPAGIWGLMTLVCGAAFVAQAIKKDSGE